jgi:hypothetical protein
VTYSQRNAYLKYAKSSYVERPLFRTGAYSHSRPNRKCLKLNDFGIFHCLLYSVGSRIRTRVICRKPFRDVGIEEFPIFMLPPEEVEGKALPMAPIEVDSLQRNRRTP